MWFFTRWYFPWLQLGVALPVPTGAGHWSAGSGPGTPRAAGRAAIFLPSVRVSIVWSGDGAMGVWDSPPQRVQPPPLNPTPRSRAPRAVSAPRGS